MTIYPKYCIIFFLIILLSTKTEAQLKVSAYLDAGETNVSEGLYVKSSLMGLYQLNKFKFEGGTQFDLKSAGSGFLTAGRLNVSREFSIKKFQFQTEGFFIYNIFSPLLHESNLGFLINIQRKHFDYKLGTEFRTYRITGRARDKYNITSDRRLNENGNLVYLIKYRLKPADYKWNAGVSLTNIDHFLINQETNPMVNIEGSYTIASPLILFAESWYKSAGSVNISANYFGFFFRTGIIWKPDLKK